MKSIVGFLSGCMWVSGIVLADGFWSTLFSIFIPLWAWYLTIERLLEMSGFIGAC